MMIIRKPIRYLLLLAFTSTVTTVLAEDLPRASPESQGVDTVKVLEFIDAADKKVNSMHSFMMLRNGKVVAEAWWAPESPDKPHVLWSLSKSFTSTAVGFAVAEGKLTVEDPVLKFMKEDELPKDVSPNLKAIHVKDLLTMSTGHQDEPMMRGQTEWTKTFLKHPLPHQPGSHFQYNTPATYMQSVIVQRATGEDILDYLEPRLFQPLGIKSPKWDKSPEGISLGGYGLYLCTEDVAKFGQLYLQRGNWKGKQLLPESWVDEATSKQVSNGSNATSDWNQGYGYQFWRCRHDAYRGDGKDGQFCIVMPKQSTVVVMTANTGDMQSELNLVWKHLLPAIQDAPLPENPELAKKLSERTAGLKATR
jgi:CubicO group peptidase (beta-lactamase class C family)